MMIIKRRIYTPNLPLGAEDNGLKLMVGQVASIGEIHGYAYLESSRVDGIMGK